MIEVLFFWIACFLVGFSIPWLIHLPKYLAHRRMRENPLPWERR